MLQTFATTNDHTIAKKLKALTESIFTADDDAITTQPDTETDPGTGTMMQDTSTNPPTNIKRNFEGQFSWIAMLSPVFPAPIPVAPAPLDQLMLTVVIFDRRTLPPSPDGKTTFNDALVSEDTAVVLQTTSNPPAGSVNVSGGETQIANPTDNQVSYAKPGNWMMLCRNDQTIGRITNWYRIVAAGVDSGTGNLDMTLSGPDWTWGNVSNINLNQYTYACLFDGAVGVYQRIIHLDGQSVWSQ